MLKINYETCTDRKMGNRLLYFSAAALLLFAVILASSIVSYGAAESVMLKDINFVQPLLYGIFAFLAMVMLIGYCIFTKKKYLWMLMMLICILIINVGYLALSLSHDIHEALLANRISYFGNSFMPFFLLLTCSDICRFRMRRSIWYALLIISVLMTITCMTAGYGNHFYKSVTFVLSDGIASLNKEYGILHGIYNLYVYVYYLISMGIAVYSIIKKRILFFRYIAMIMVVTSVNVVVWVIERLVGIHFELLSISYVFMTFVLMILYSEMTEYGLLNCFRIITDTTEQEQISQPITRPAITRTVISNPVNLKNDAQQEICAEAEVQTVASVESAARQSISQELIAERIYERYSNMDFLTKRELEVLILLMEGTKRRIIAEKLVITENTLKTHIGSIYSKFGVSRRSELTEIILSEIHTQE